MNIRAVIWVGIILSGIIIAGCGNYNKSVKDAQNSSLITRPTTDLTVFKSKF